MAGLDAGLNYYRQSQGRSVESLPFLFLVQSGSGFQL